MKTAGMKRVWLLAVVLLLGHGWTLAATDAVVVVPNRYRMVKLAFDLHALRGVEMLSYNGSPGDSNPQLYRWDPRSGGWIQLSLDAYRGGVWRSTAPQRVVLIGGSLELPEVLLAASGQLATTAHIPNLEMVTVVNALDRQFSFTPAEWSMLAARHGLTLKDVNEQRRRYGRFGPRGETDTIAATEDRLEPLPVAVDPEPYPIDPSAVVEDEQVLESTVQVEPEPTALEPAGPRQEEKGQPQEKGVPSVDEDLLPMDK